MPISTPHKAPNPEHCLPRVRGGYGQFYWHTFSKQIDADCKPKVEASSSQRIDKNPVINGIKYNGCHMTTNQLHKATVVCAYYGWTLKHERTEDLWVLTHYVNS